MDNKLIFFIGIPLAFLFMIIGGAGLSSELGGITLEQWLWYIIPMSSILGAWYGFE